MKSLKTYNMDQDCIQILAKQQNKSQFVCQAVRHLSNKSESLDLDVIDTRYLLINLRHREISEALKTLILLELSTSI
jgi:hypothetical protein